MTHHVTKEENRDLQPQEKNNSKIRTWWLPSSVAQ